MYADTIIDISKILKDNQSIMVDGKTNQINGILEILPNGKIIKRKIGTQEKKILTKQLEAIKKSHITTWDKNVIIYEQEVEVINIDR